MAAHMSQRRHRKWMWSVLSICHFAPCHFNGSGNSFTNPLRPLPSRLLAAFQPQGHSAYCQDTVLQACKHSLSKQRSVAYRLRGAVVSLKKKCTCCKGSFRHRTLTWLSCTSSANQLSAALLTEPLLLLPPLAKLQGL